MRHDLKTDILVSALGTTLKKAGSKNEFMKIDHDLTFKISKIAKEEGCRTMILISSIGANYESKIFYSKVKGLLEISLKEIGFEELHILRPSLLLGKRTEDRPVENISKCIIGHLSFLFSHRLLKLFLLQLVLDHQVLELLRSRTQELLLHIR